MARRFLLRSTACCCLLALPMSLRAEALDLPRPAVAPFPIQLDGPFPGGYYSDLLPGVAIAADGSFVAAWSRSPGGRSDVVARLFDERGRPRGPLIEVSGTSQPNVFNQHAQVAMMPGGGFVVVWIAAGVQGETILAQLFSSGGARSGQPVEVTTPGQILDLGPAALGVDRAGVFAVGFRDATGAALRRFNRHGEALGPAVQVSGTSDAEAPTLVMQPNGDILLAWWIAEAGKTQVMGQRFNAAGEAVGEPLQISASSVPSSGSAAAAATPGGGFVVTYSACPPAPPRTAPCSVFARFYDAAANPQSGALAVTTTAVGQLGEPPAIAADARGNVLIAWQTCAVNANCVVAARAYSPQQQASEVAVLTTGDDLADPAVAAGPTGFLVAFDTLTCSAPGCDIDLIDGVFGWRFGFPDESAAAPATPADSLPAPADQRRQR
jgi:hypothetical protein